MDKKALLVILFTITVLVSLGTAAAGTFDFYGYTKYANGTVINNTNVTVIRYNASANWAEVAPRYSAVSNSSNGGFFNVTAVPDDATDTIFYKPVIVHYNDSNNIYADWIGPTLSDFGYQEFSATNEGANNVTFYLREAATINVTSNNGTAGIAKPFHYQLKDTSLGYPVAQEWNNYVNSTLLYVPQGRNYSVMIYPNESFPVSANIAASDISDSYHSKEFNCSELTARYTGYVNASGVSGWDSLRVVNYLVEPGRMIYFGEYGMFNFTDMNGDYDSYDAAAGTYNITVITPAENGTLIAFYVAYNSTAGYYGGFKQVNLVYGASPSATNVTLQKLAGSAANITAMGGSGSQNVSTSLMAFNIKNSSGSQVTGFVHMEMEVYYDSLGMTNFTFMTDASGDAGGVVRLPLLNATAVRKVNVYTMGAPPYKKSLTAADMSSSPYNFTLKDMLAMEDPDTGAFSGDLYLDLAQYSSACNVPNYNASACSFFASAQDMDDVNPMGIVLGGGKYNFVMSKGTGASAITIIYTNVDMMASGPPDALFDDDSSDTAGASTFEQAWKFGSSGPEIYEDVMIGIPYTEGSSSQTGFNESAGLNISVPYLYGDSYASPVWTYGTNNLSEINSSSATLSDWADWIGTAYEAYLNGTGAACNSSDVNLSSGICYLDTTNNRIWFKIPHFSGISSEISGSVITASSTASGGGGGATNDKALGAVAAGTAVSVELASGQTAKFSIGGVEHKVQVKKLTTNSATLEISSKPIELTLSVNESKQVDVNADGSNDLEIRLTKIESSKAYLSIKNVQSAQQEGAGNATAGTPSAEAAAKQPVKLGWKAILVLVVVLAAVLGTAYVFVRKKGKA